MIKYRKGSRLKDMIGAAVLAFAATLLWAGSSPAHEQPEDATVTAETHASIGPLEGEYLGRI